MRLAVRSWGPEGGPVVVLVHGVVASGRTWWRVGPALAARGWRVLAVDLRGHGGSPSPDGVFGLDDLAADLWETLAAEGVVPDVLWGHSLGALTVLEALRQRPDGAARLVLEDPPGPGSTDEIAVAAGLQVDVATAQADLEAFLAAQRLDNPAWAEGDILAREDVARCQADVVAASVMAGIIPDVVAWLAEAPVPALLVLGTADRGSMLTGSERAAATAALPDDDVVVLDAGHGVHREATDAYLEVTTRWLER
jgi:pimeloyl-ACP methyl ester carboxylesterase